MDESGEKKQSPLSGAANNINSLAGRFARRGLSKMTAAAGSAFGPAGTAAGYVGGEVAGRFGKYIVYGLGGLVGFVVFAGFLIIIVFLTVIVGGSSSAEADTPPPLVIGDGSTPSGCPMTGTITTPFGFNIPDYVSDAWHVGVDIGDGSDTDTPIHSTITGEAILAGDSDELGGYQVVVENENYSVKFLHVEKEGRAEGPVTIGDVVATEGNTGTASVGEHLHYTIYKGGVAVNSTDYMPVTLNYTQPEGDDFAETSVPEKGWGTCDALPSGGGVLAYYILYGDTTIVPADPVAVKETANLSWPGNNINKTCPGGVNCWEYVIQQSKSNGISPAFSIAIWWEEGGFGGAGANSEFGCFPGGDTSQQLDFLTSFNCFVEFTSVEHPYDSVDPSGSFTEWVRFFCGPAADPICSNNPGFIDRLATIYESVAPGKIVHLSDISDSSGIRTDLFNFSGGWTESEKKIISQAINVPVKSTTWKNLVFGAGKVTLSRESVDPDCPTVCSGYATGPNTMKIFDLFFTKTGAGRYFVITHELTHILQKRNSGVFTQYKSSSAYVEYSTIGIIRSYPLCDPDTNTCQTLPSGFTPNPENEDFAEMAGNYVSDRDGTPIDFPKEYPEHYKFARDKLFGETSF